MLEAQGLLYPCFATRAEIGQRRPATPLDPDGAPLYPGLHKSLAEGEIEARIAAGERLRPAPRHGARGGARQSAGSAGAPLTFTELDANGRAPGRWRPQPERWGDAVILRKDVPASYHLAVVVDDARQGVTHVTRGRDLYAATDLQRLLQVLLGLPEPLYHHHRLVTDEQGRKLSKSASDTALRKSSIERRVAGRHP